MDERRRVPRFPFYAEAHITEVASGIKFTARTSELSRHGCYIDIMNPFPSVTVVNITLVYNHEEFRAPGAVVYSQPSMGMGVAFGEIADSDEKLLEKWLEELQAE